MRENRLPDRSRRSGLPGKLETVLAYWLTPRAEGRDAAFRERFLRSTIGILTVLGAASFLVTIVVFKDEWRPISFPTLHVVALLSCVLAGAATFKGRLVLAGWLIVMLVLLGTSGVVLLARQEGSAEGVVLAVPIYLMVPVVAAVVLPRSQIIPVSLFTVAVYALVHFGIPVDDRTFVTISPGQVIVPVVLIFLAMGLLLQQLRTEFDERLEEMRNSVVQIEEAQRRLVSALQQAEADRARAEDADRAKSQFLANTSHELRTPLNAIIGYNEAMLAGMVGEFSPKQLELLGIMQRSSRRLLGLINDILDLSKIEAGSMELQLATMDPAQVIHQTVENLRSLSHDKGLALDVAIAATVPAEFVNDPHKFEQIITNLLSNAIKFTQTGRVMVRGHGTPEGALVMSVQDTGIGIPDEALEFIFNPFRQVDGSLQRRYSGSGLGLSITRRLVQTLGGEITVESRVGVGTTFTVTLPALDLPEQM